jgi:hypothetical protein
MIRMGMIASELERRPGPNLVFDALIILLVNVDSLTALVSGRRYLPAVHPFV